MKKTQNGLFKLQTSSKIETERRKNQMNAKVKLKKLRLYWMNGLHRTIDRWFKNSMTINSHAEWFKRFKTRKNDTKRW